jgi:predicted  nucleic acid-binding Zn-ribbon protein
MPTTTKAKAAKTAKTKNTLADIEGELELLQDRHGQATSGVEEARRRLDALATRRAVIATDAYFGAVPAVEEMAALDVEVSTLTRSISLALDAAGALEASIVDAKGRLAEAKRQVHRERYEELARERERLFERRDGLARDLDTVLEEADRLSFEMQKTLNLYDQPAANTMATNGLGVTRAWIERTFAGWLR